MPFVSLVAWALLCLLAVLAVRGRALYVRAGRVTPAEWVWFGFFAALAVVFGVLSMVGLVSGQALFPFIGLNVGLVVGGGVSLMRNWIRHVLANLRIAGHHIPPVLLEVVLVGLAVYLSTLAFELPSNPYLPTINTTGFLIELVMFALAFVALHLLTMRTGAGVAAGAVVLALAGLIEYFVVLFKSVPVMPGDLYALGTAAAVSGGYVYMFSDLAIGGVAIAVAAVLLGSLVPKNRPAMAAAASELAANADAMLELNAVTDAVEPAVDVVSQVEELAGAELELDAVAAVESQSAAHESRVIASDAPAAELVESLESEDDAHDVEADSAAIDQPYEPSAPEAPKSRPRRRGIRVAAHVGAGVAVALVLVAVVANTSLSKVFGVTIDNWNPVSSYRTWGAMTSLVAGVQNAVPVMPDGYTNEGAQQLLASYADEYDQDRGASDQRVAAVKQFDAMQPSVVVIMNESFADLSIFDQMHAGYEGPEQFVDSDSVLYEGSVAMGPLYVSPYAGGTCNSEFELFTGISCAYMGTGTYPYLAYDLAEVANITSQFAQMGYVTTAMHPNLAANYNRDVVYPALGFQQFLDIDAFTDPTRLRGVVDDASTYDMVLELLQDESAPQFIFDLTMQNHSNYDTGLLPSEMVTNYLVDGVTDDPQLDEYLALIDESDRALEDFLVQLEKLDRPVVVVFFGDHQPQVSYGYNDKFFPDDASQLDHVQRLHQTVYAVWANYDVKGAPRNLEPTTTSSNYLGAVALEAIGAPLSDYQKACLVISDQIPLLTAVAYTDITDTWISSSSPDADDAAYYDMQVLSYLQMFGNGVKMQQESSFNGWA